METAIRSAQERLCAEFQESQSESRRDDPESAAAASSLELGSSGKLGYWLGDLEADTTLESDYIVFLTFLDEEGNREKIRRLASTILARQQDDGSWNIFPGGPGEISATVKGYLALRLAGYEPSEPFMVKAKEATLRLGGAEKVNSYTKFYLALLGQLEWWEVPAIPPEVILLPRFLPINIYEISYWSRAILIPLSILYSKRATRRPSAGAQLVEDLFHDRAALKRFDGGTGGDKNGTNGSAANGSNGHAHTNGSNGHAHTNGTNGHTNGNGHSNANGNGHVNGNGNGNGTNDESILLSDDGPSTSSHRGPGWVSWENFFLVTDRLLKLAERAGLRPLRKIALRKAEEWMVARFEDSDGLGAIFPSMVNSVLALVVLGKELDHPLVVEALSQLEDLEIDEGEGLRLQPCLSPIWDTAKAVNALHESGLPADHPQLQAAARWLVEKEVRKPGDWQMRVPHVDVGGWPFQFRNEFYPDVDDTAAVVMALGRVDDRDVPGIKDSITRGINWVTQMQCSCGGWAAFDVDVKREFLTKVPYADHNAMLDPPCPDITGRCLEMYGRFPEVRKDPNVQRVIEKGIEYLKSTQEPDGSWYGRWGVNYIYGTWQTLKGLAAVGEDPSQPYIQKAAHFLKTHQNADGGWGESCLSYEPDHQVEARGRGDSTPSQTGWALMGLIAAGEIDSPEAERGVRYLLETQRPDGNWNEDLWTGTGFPCVFYLNYHLYRLYFPLFALGMYRNKKAKQPGVSRITGEAVDFGIRRGGLPSMSSES
ncbi:MAG: squalene--hopene cyclase [Planctomycetota bacterium]